MSFDTIWFIFIIKGKANRKISTSPSTVPFSSFLLFTGTTPFLPSFVSLLLGFVFLTLCSSFHAGSDNQSAKDEGRTVQAKMQPDAASRYDTASSKHKASQLTANNYPSTLQDYIPEQLFPEKLQPPQVPIEEGSVLQKWVFFSYLLFETYSIINKRRRLCKGNADFWIRILCVFLLYFSVKDEGSFTWLYHPKI